MATHVITWWCPGCDAEGKAEGKDSREARDKLHQIEEAHKPHLGYQRFVTEEAER